MLGEGRFRIDRFPFNPGWLTVLILPVVAMGLDRESGIPSPNMMADTSELFRGDAAPARVERSVRAARPRIELDVYDRLVNPRAVAEAADDDTSDHLDFLLSSGPVPENRSVACRAFSTELGMVHHPYTNAQDVRTTVTRIGDDLPTLDGSDFPIARMSLAEALDESIRISARDARGLREAIGARSTTTMRVSHRDIDGDGDLEQLTSVRSGLLTINTIDGLSADHLPTDDVLCTLMRSAFIAE